MKTFTLKELQSLKSLLTFHDDDWDTIKEIYGFDIEPLFNKICDLEWNEINK